MIEISGTTVIDRIPKGGETVDLMMSILRAREAADTCATLAKQAERGEHPFLATFWNEIAELHTQVLERATTAAARLEDESAARASEGGELDTGGRPTKHRRPDDPKSVS